MKTLWRAKLITADGCTRILKVKPTATLYTALIPNLTPRVFYSGEAIPTDTMSAKVRKYGYTGWNGKTMQYREIL